MGDRLATVEPRTILGGQSVGRKPGKQRSRQYRLDDDVSAMVERIAALHDPPVSVPDFLSEFLRPLLRKRLASELDRASRQLKDRED